MLNTLVFWFAVLLGTAVLAPALILPAWVEYEAQRAYLQSHRECVAALRQRLAAVRKQVEHLENDPAYVLRTAEQEFGRGIALPNVETVFIAPSPSAADGPPVPAATSQPAAVTDPLHLPELSQFIENAMRRHPRLQMFLDDRARPLLMGMGGLMIVAGIVLLGFSDSRRAAPRLGDGDGEGTAGEESPGAGRQACQ